MTVGSHLIVPIKPLHLAKSRLLASYTGPGRPAEHTSLVTALALDTVHSARSARGVEQVVVVTSDPELASVFASEGVEVLPDTPAAGLNAALHHASEALRQRRSGPVRVGALQADLPALRPADLSAALAHAGPRRAFCADRQGTGTTLLLAAPGTALDPRFGPSSAAAHTASGALALGGPWDSLRCDVDTAADLRAARDLGLGPHTSGRFAAPHTGAAGADR